MARYPGAIYKPITASKGRKRLTIYNRVNLHVAASEATSLHGYFNRSGIPDSHFYVRRDGTVEQYVDTAYRAFADLEGNDATISIETQGMGSGKWTDAQVKSIASLYAWAVKTHGIKVQVAKDAKIGDSSKGLSWHRLGIDGNFPNGELGGRLQRGGGMHYSSSRGKVCPGDDRIKQVPEIFALAKKILGGAEPVSNPKPSTPKPAPKPSAPKPSKPAKGALKVDGIWGEATTRRLQQVLGTPVDGVVSSQPGTWRASNPGLSTGWKWVAKPKGSKVIVALQQRLAVKPDGLIGPNTIKALQRRMRTPVDGEIWRGSAAVMELQRRLNKGQI